MEDRIGETCSRNWGDKNAHRIVVGKPERKISFGIGRHK
jgi:hypothetical protein